MRISLTLAAFLLAANQALAQAPTLKLVTGVDKNKGVLIFRETVFRSVFVEKQVKEVVDGQAVVKKVQEVVQVPEERTSTIALANARVITPDGKQLPIDEVWKKLKANTVVAVAGIAGVPPQPFLRALSPETLIIIAPLPPPSEIVPPKKLPPPVKKAP